MSASQGSVSPRQAVERIMTKIDQAIGDSVRRLQTDLIVAGADLEDIEAAVAEAREVQVSGRPGLVIKVEAIVKRAALELSEEASAEPHRMS